MGLLLATFFGMLRFTPEISLFANHFELYGKVGLFLGTILSRLLGGLGSIIFLVAAMLFVSIIAFDFKLNSILEYFKSLFREREDANLQLKVKLPEEELERALSNLFLAFTTFLIPG